MSRILVIKTAALGDVLRTTSILPGLCAQQPAPRVTWFTAPGAKPLVAHHPQVAEVITADPRDAAAVAKAGEPLRQVRWQRVLSLDDELPLCRLASQMSCDRLSGAYLGRSGAIEYTDDVAPWFDMGLLSRHGKSHADRLKVENRRSHPAIFADMLGVAMGQPELPLSDAARAFAEQFAARTGLGKRRPLIGLNTGAGGRWRSKGLPIERVVELVDRLHAAMSGQVGFVLLGGPEERDRNATIAQGVRSLPSRPELIDAGTDNGLLEFAAIVDRCDLLVTSDSLALHMAIARRRKIVVFFAPTSAAEIELYGLGEKVVSTAPDYCSYQPDADNSTITAERVAAACLRVLRG